MKYAFPAIFTPAEEGGFCVVFPDIQRGATQGDDMTFWGFYLYHHRRHGRISPHGRK